MNKEIKNNLFIASIIFGIILSVLILISMSKRISPILFNYAELEIQKLSTAIINRAVNKQLANGMDTDSLFTIIKNNENEIQTIDFNPTIVNKILNTTTNVVLINLKAVEEGNIDFIELPDVLIKTDEKNLKNGIIYELPLGVVTNNTFISNIGPKLPIKLNVIGSVEANIKTNIKEYGINNALIEVYVRIIVTEQVNVPFISKRISVSTDIPIALKIIQGKVPQYFGGNMSKESSILSIPIQ